MFSMFFYICIFSYFINKFWSTRFSNIVFCYVVASIDTARINWGFGSLVSFICANSARCNCALLKQICKPLKVMNEIFKNNLITFLSLSVKFCMLRYITGYIAIVVFPAGYRIFGSRMFGSKPSNKQTFNVSLVIGKTLKRLVWNSCLLLN